MTSNFDELHNVEGSVRIQGERIEIDLNNAATNRDNGHFRKYCCRHNFNYRIVDDIMQHCKRVMKLDIGTASFKYSNVGTFSLICTNNSSDQDLHIDIVGYSSNVQYVMMVSDRCKTTKICQPKSIDNLDNLKDVANFLINGATQHKLWLEPQSSNLVTMIEKLPVTSDTAKYIDNGLGELFKISSNENSRYEDYDYQSKYISDCPAGTIVSTEGNVIHAGTGTSQGNIRNILFFTYSKGKKYDTDVQYTKLSVIATLMKDLWNMQNVRLDLLKLLYYCFDTTSITYQETCVGCFRHFSGMYKMLNTLDTLRENKTNNEKNVMDVLAVSYTHLTLPTILLV